MRQMTAMDNRENNDARSTAFGRRYWWVVIFAFAAAVDIAGRFVLAFDMLRVAVFESVLFGSTGVLFAVIDTKYRHASVPIRRLEIGLAAAFGLAALRVILWAAGAGVAVANVVVAVVGVGLVTGLLIRKRYVGRRRPS